MAAADEQPGSAAHVLELGAGVGPRRYERCLPMATSELAITAATSGADAGLLGAGHATLRELAAGGRPMPLAGAAAR